MLKSSDPSQDGWLLLSKVVSSGFDIVTLGLLISFRCIRPKRAILAVICLSFGLWSCSLYRHFFWPSVLSCMYTLSFCSVFLAEADSSPSFIQLSFHALSALSRLVPLAEACSSPSSTSPT